MPCLPESEPASATLRASVESLTAPQSCRGKPFANSTRTLSASFRIQDDGESAMVRSKAWRTNFYQPIVRLSGAPCTDPGTVGRLHPCLVETGLGAGTASYRRAWLTVGADLPFAAVRAYEARVPCASGFVAEHGHPVEKTIDSRAFCRGCANGDGFQCFASPPRPESHSFFCERSTGSSPCPGWCDQDDCWTIWSGC